MITLDLSNRKVITDSDNTFFKNNNFMIGTGIPTSGTYNVGDVIINTGVTANIEPMWICVEAGSPGLWKVPSSGSGTELVYIQGYTILDKDATKVNININNFNKETDLLIVYKNSTYLTEGLDFELKASSIEAKEGNWSKGDLFSFTALRHIAKINEDDYAVISADHIIDGAISLNKLAGDVKEAIENASNIDLSNYATKDDLEQIMNELSAVRSTMIRNLNDYTDHL